MKKQEYRQVFDAEIISRFWAGCTTEELISYVAKSEGTKKKEAKGCVELVLYEAMKRNKQ